MSICNKDLYDRNSAENCSKCGIITLKNKFHKNKLKNNKLDLMCIFYEQKSCFENRDRIKDYFLENRDRIKEYQLKNHYKIFACKNIYSNNRYKTDIIFRLFCKTRSKIRQALNTK